MSDEPTAVTKEREWFCAFKFRVPETPDPTYDVAAHERYADALGLQIESALSRLDASDLVIETLTVNEQ